jgi:hypothetical protein
MNGMTETMFSAPSKSFPHAAKLSKWKSFGVGFGCKALTIIVNVNFVLSLCDFGG